MWSRYWQLLAEVRASYSPEKAADERRSEFLAAVLYRPLSFWITPFFLMARWTADGVTALSFAVALAMPLAAWVVGARGYWAVAVIGLGFQVLDCVDGNIARTMRRFSRVGPMLDGLSSLLFWAFYFIAVGVLAEAAGAGWIGRHGREIGLGLAVLLLMQREMEDTFDACFQERVRWEPPVPAGLPRWDLKQIGKPAEQILAFGGLAVAGATGGLGYFLGALAAYQTVLFALWLPRFVRAVRAKGKTD